MENGVLIFIVTIFIIMIATILIRAGRGVFVWSKNNASPVLSEHVKVVAKRQEFEDGVGDTPGTTRYFVTFERSSRDRMELQVKAKHYGLIAEGDLGTLTYQGTRFLGFERQ